MAQDPSLTSYTARLIDDTPAGRIPRGGIHPAIRSMLDGKSRECAAWGGLSKPNAETIVDLVFDLEKAKNIRRLTAPAGDFLRLTDRQNQIQILTAACCGYRFLQTACRRPLN
jgi:hypothetical protein